MNGHEIIQSIHVREYKEYLLNGNPIDHKGYIIVTNKQTIRVGAFDLSSKDPSVVNIVGNSARMNAEGAVIQSMYLSPTLPNDVATHIKERIAKGTYATLVIETSAGLLEFLICKYGTQFNYFTPARIVSDQLNIELWLRDSFLNALNYEPHFYYINNEEVHVGSLVCSASKYAPVVQNKIIDHYGVVNLTIHTTKPLVNMGRIAATDCFYRLYRRNSSTDITLIAVFQDKDVANACRDKMQEVFTDEMFFVKEIRFEEEKYEI
jgi:hypothetical protein